MLELGEDRPVRLDKVDCDRQTWRGRHDRVAGNANLRVRTDFIFDVPQGLVVRLAT